MQRLGALFFAAGETNIQRTLQHVFADIQALGFRPHEFEKLNGIQLIFAPCLALGIHRRFQKGHCGHAGNFSRILKRKEDACRRALFNREFGQVLALVKNMTRCDFIIFAPGQDVGKRAFAGAVRPHNCVHFTFGNGERNPFQDFLTFAFDGDMQVTNFQKWRCHFLLRLSGSASVSRHCLPVKC